MYNIFDSHCHYSDSCFDEDREKVLIGLNANGVKAILHAGADLPTSNFGVQYAEKFPFIYTSVGLHPEEAGKAPEDYLIQLRGLIEKSNKVVAVGEIGLDYHYEGFSRAEQIRLFEDQLMLAHEYSLPVIVHSRDATEDCMNILKKYKPRGVMHCFSGSAETACEVQELGMYISFTGVVTFKNARKSHEAVLAVSNDRILLETDCPYMAPEPNRGKRCDSSMIAYTAAKIAELKGVEPQELINICTENTCRLFGITLE